MTQKEALDILKTGRNVYLTGAAGSGKTHVLNTYISYLKDRAVSVAVTASTGIAATHLGGMTIHSWSGIGIKDDLSDRDIEFMVQKEHLFKRYDKTNVLIIDEVSMIHPRMFDALDRLARAMKRVETPFGGMQVVLSGDFFQLPPITPGRSEVMYVDRSRAWRQMDLRVCYLEEQFRQEDRSLTKILNEIRTGVVSPQTEAVFTKMNGARKRTDTSQTRLYTHNVDVDAVNDTELEKLPGLVHEYKMTTFGKASVVAALRKSILAPEVLRLKKNAVVMFVKNNFEEGYVNGTLGRVLDFKGNMPVVQTRSGKMISVTEASWEVEDDGKVLASANQLPLRLAWAITVHKSQGMSLDAAEIDLSRSFVHGQGYVALSRLRSLDGLTLLGLNSMALSVDPYVIELDRWLSSESSKWSRVIERFESDDWERMHKDFIIRSGGTNDPVEIKKNKEAELTPLAHKIPSHEKTLALLQERKPIRDIAQERGMTLGTIIGHLEKLKDGGYELDLSPYAPRGSDLKMIRAALRRLVIQNLHRCTRN